jgi:hypothetical protein
MCIDEIEHKILKGDGELSFALTGKFQNLRVWGGHDGNGPVPINTIFMRYDHANQTSAPWDPEKLRQYFSPKDFPGQLSDFGFKTSITRLRELSKILCTMTPRACIAW